MQDVPASASFFWSHTGLERYRHVFRERVQPYASASRMKKYQSKRKLRFEKSIAQFPNLCTVHMLSHILLQTCIYYITERVQINFEHSSDINANDFKRHVWGKALAGCAGLKLRNDAHQSVALILHLFMHVSLYIPMSFVLPWEWPTVWSELHHKWITKTIKYSGSLSARAAAVGHTGWWLAKEVPPPSEDEIMNFCQKLSRQIFTIHRSHVWVFQFMMFDRVFVELLEGAVIGSSI